MKIVLIIAVVLIIFASFGYCQNTQELLGQVAEIYSQSETTGNGLIMGFSMWGLIGGIFFGSIGFVAFVYGKKNSEFRPMILGLILMSYPYFIKSTIALYLVGITLTFILFVWRE